MSHRTTILIAIPTLAPHDAMGRDVIMGAKALTNAGYNVKIFAEHAAKNCPAKVITKEEALSVIANSDNIFLYHMGVYWHLLPELLGQCRAKFIVKYHNMTPPRFFETYDKGSVAATKLGLEQVRWMMKAHLPDGFIGASDYNLLELSAWIGGSPLAKSPKKITSIAPFIEIAELKTAGDDPSIKALASKSRVNILFVGRLVPNKGHQHLIATLKSYEQLYGSDVQLILCGSLGPGFTKYKTDLLRLAKIGGMTDKLTFINDANDQKLASLYRTCQVFLCMSEHEGFCVPVVESQMLGLPVIAWDQAAVASTVGQGGIVLKNLNYDVFATAIHRIQSDQGLRKHILELGFKNAERFNTTILGQQTIDFISKV